MAFLQSSTHTHLLVFHVDYSSKQLEHGVLVEKAVRLKIRNVQGGLDAMPIPRNFRGTTMELTVTHKGSVITASM